MINNKEELLSDIEDALEKTKDFNLFKHLFSEDSAIETLAKLRQLLIKIKTNIKISTFKDIGFPEEKSFKQNKGRHLVSVRPVGEEYQGKTYLGFYIGDLPLGSGIKIDDEKLVCYWSHYNPAIYVPEINKVVYGAESWWSEIECEEDFRKITNKDINDVWYVQLAKKMFGKENNLGNSNE